MNFLEIGEVKGRSIFRISPSSLSSRRNPNYDLIIVN
jgi:hypothetical protein